MRWISFFPNGNQGWAEWRRTGFPVLVPAVAATNSSKQIVRRFVYPVTESTLNKSRYSAAVSTIKWWR
ncbi:MAG: SusD/RagB family nutrient-binding outer membrane lipoprotein [Saprospiraceae bacterium]|nr:SusD/RagB family nutrient-binding outer membrane lipoprotein [Saprospiraceae bacterium]